MFEKRDAHSRGFSLSTAVTLTLESSLLEVSGYLRAVLRKGPVGDILESQRPLGEGQVQEERERELCFDLDDSPRADLLMVSHYRKRQENEL